MIAVEYDRYGAVEELHVREVSELGDLAPSTIRIRVASTSVNPKDTFVRKGRFKAVASERFPKRVGYDWSGSVIAVGDDVWGVRVGDFAFGMVNGWEGSTCATTIDVKPQESAILSDGADIFEAAAVPLAGQTALQALRDLARVEPGHRVAINGASGGVGLFAVALAKYLGAHVTAIAGASSEAICRDSGCDAFVDYAEQPSFERAGSFDAIFDVFGNLAYDDFADRLTMRGAFVSTVPNAKIFAAATATREETAKRARLVNVVSRASDLALLASLVQNGTLRIHIDRRYDVADIRAAHDHVERKHTRGKVLVTL